MFFVGSYRNIESACDMAGSKDLGNFEIVTVAIIPAGRYDGWSFHVVELRQASGRGCVTAHGSLHCHFRFKFHRVSQYTLSGKARFEFPVQVMRPVLRLDRLRSIDEHD